MPPVCHGHFFSSLIYDELQDSSRVLNQKETLLAREKIERIKETWTKWIWDDAGRTERLCRIYNELFNSSGRRDFSGAHLRLPGINTTVLRGGDLALHQKDAVWMILQTPSVLLDLCVGAGKTFIMLAAAHELKRLGLARKILLTVPNHLTEQWASEANHLYPDMRVLAMSADDFSKERRGTFLSRIATEEWDVIICAHTSFGFIETGGVAKEFIQIEVDELRSYLEAMRRKSDISRTDKRTMKEIERKILAFETRLKQQEYRVTHDDARIITWDELGIDALMVDEAHEFKNLSIPTMLGSLPGVPTGDSKRAFDMRIKTWDLRRRGGRVVFATGTPVLNTLGEVFIMQKYLQEDVLAAHGIEHFDAWASTFAETQTVLEMTPDGGGFRMNTRLCKFVNLPELFNLWFQMTFSRSREQLGLPTPKLIGGKPIPVSVPGSPTLKALVRSFVSRVEAIKSGAIEPWDDNMLKVTSDGRKAALDVRLITGGAEEPTCKINMLVNTVAELHHRYDAAKATQLIYCELSTPKPQKQVQAILGHVMLVADGNRLTISATNLEIGMVVTVAAKVAHPGAITLPAKLLSDVVGSLPNQAITLVMDTRAMSVALTCGAFEATIKGIAAEEFPSIPTIADRAPAATFAPEALCSAVDQVAFAAASDETRPVLTITSLLERVERSERAALVYQAEAARALHCATLAEQLPTQPEAPGRRARPIPSTAIYEYPGQERICRVCGRPAPPPPPHRQDGLRVYGLERCRQEARRRDNVTKQQRCVARKRAQQA